MKGLSAASLFFLVLFGRWYARRVRYKPIKPTWWEVVIGVAATIWGFFGLIWSIYGINQAIMIVLILIGSFALTGLPMIYHQYKKSQDWLREIEQEKKRDTGPLNARAKTMAVHFPAEQRPRSD